ncbi:MAG: MCP four helix bundle domain-containing protein [Bryobacteraceae bacterium]|jgi:hypothetical protein
MGDIDAKAKEITLGSLPKVYFVGQIEKNVQTTNSLALQHATTSDKQEKAALDAEIQTIRATNSGVVTEYEKLINTEKGR